MICPRCTKDKPDSEVVLTGWCRKCSTTKLPPGGVITKPGNVTVAEDVEDLRERGWSRSEILEHYQKSEPLAVEEVEELLEEQEGDE